MADRYEHETPGPVRWWRDVSGLLGRRASQIFAEVQDLIDRADRQLGIISGTIIVGSPVTISGPVTITGDVIARSLSGGIDSNLYVENYPVSGTNPVPVEDTWDVTTISDSAANDSNKVFTVPVGYEWQMLWIWAELTSDATVGNRQMEVRLHDNTGDIIGRVPVGAVQAASLERHYMWAPALADLLGFRDTDYLMTPLPPTVFLPAGYAVSVWDNAEISAAGDDLVVHVQVARRIA